MIVKMSPEKRIDYRIISEIIEPGSRVLDLGCGDGELLEILFQKKQVLGQGIEIDEANISKCIARGVNVIQGDVDEGLEDYPDFSFDYVILNQTLQVVKKPDVVLKEMVRVGKKGVVGFPNFAHWQVRFQVFFKGMMPKTPELPFEWYNTPNIHLLTIKDFERFCREHNIEILQRYFISRERLIPAWLFPNLFSRLAIYLIKSSELRSE